MITLTNINKYYYSDENKFHALKNINLSINKGDFLAIMGQSGSGKSTLVNIIGLLDKEFDGEYKFEDQSVKELEDKKITNIRNKNIGFVFQEFNLIKRLTVKENIELPMLYSGQSIRSCAQKVESLLDSVNLKEQMNKFPNQLSGGQQQRIAILRALANDPEVIIADEPTGALDSKTSEEIMELFTKLNEDGLTIILITHDINVAKKAKKIINIFDGVIVEEKN